MNVFNIFDNVNRDGPQHNDIRIGMPKKSKEVPNFESTIEIQSNWRNHVNSIGNMKKFWFWLKPREEHIAVIDMVHGLNNFETTITKWKKISIIVMDTCCS